MENNTTTKNLDWNRMENKKTAVEFLVESFVKHFGAGWLTDETIKQEIQQVKQIEKAEKIKAQVELLEHLNLNWDLEGIHPGKEDYLVEIKWLKTKLKELELTFK